MITQTSQAGSSLASILEAIEKPLLFASKNDCAYLHTIKGLNELIPELAGRAYELAETPVLKNFFTSLQNAFISFYTLQQDQQKNLILSTIAAFSKLQAPDAALGKPAIPPASGPETAEPSETPAVSIHDAILLLSTPVEKIKGVGPKTAEALVRKNIRTIEDVLYHVPRSYIDRRSISKISDLTPGRHATVIGKILTARVGHLSGRTRVFDLLIADGSGVLSAKWFNVNMPYAHMLKKKYCEGESVLVAGQTTQFKFRIEMHHPEIELLAEEESPAANLSIVPVYPLTEGISQKVLHKISRQAVEQYARRPARLSA